MPLRIYRRRLPHWRVEGATYFVTWCLHRGQSVLMAHERTSVLTVLRRYDRIRLELIAGVVMDDHVHVVVRPHPGHPLERVVQGWKAASAYRLRQGGRRAPFWQREYHDRIIRSDSDLREKILYLANNPLRRWLGMADYPWLHMRVGAEL